MSSTVNTDSASHRNMERSLRGPDWRRQRASALPDQLSAREARGCDPAIRDYHDYLQRISGASDDGLTADAAHPAIAAAERLQADQGLSDALKVMVVGGLPSQEICARLEIDLPVLEAWEQLYFDVRPMRELATWIAAHVVERERRQGRAALAAKLKLALAGPEAARAALAAGGRLPLDEAEQLFDQQVRLQLKFDEALDSQLKPLAFLSIFLQLQHQRLRLELDRQKLAERAKEAERRHELALLREQRAEQREQQRQLREEQRRKARLERQTVGRGERGGAVDPLLAEAERYALADRIARSPLSQIVWRTAAQPPAPQPVIHSQELIETPEANRPRTDGLHRLRRAPNTSVERSAFPVEALACSA